MTKLRVATLCFIVMFAVSCAQPGTLPTAPSATAGVPGAAAVGPSAGYDATGRWRFVLTSANPNLNETFDSDVHQDPVTGNLSLLDDDGNPVVLERLSHGAGAIITYRQDIIGEGDPCDLRIQGTARLDTRTNTLTASIRFKELGCGKERAGAVVTGTKLS